MMEALTSDHRHTGKLASIQFLRAIAVMLVVYMHSLDLQPHALQQGLLFLPGFGAAGVDIFFVISGFIISWSAGRYNGNRDGRKFLFHRFRRLIPVYWLATLLFMIVQVRYVLRPGAAGFHSVPFLLKTIFLLPIADNNVFILPFLSVAWTLSFEWLFYLIFACSIALPTKRREWFLCGSIILFTVAGALFHPVDPRLNFLTNPIALEFAAGAALFSCYKKFNIPVAAAIFLVLTGLSIFIVEIIFGFGDVAIMENIVNGRLAFRRVLLWGIPSSLIMAGCLFLEKCGKGQFMWDNRWFTLIGNASYSIYLVHLSVYGLCILAYNHRGAFPSPDLAVFLQAILAIAGGLLFYRWVEMPLLQKWRR